MLGHDTAGGVHLLLACCRVDAWVADLLAGKGVHHRDVFGRQESGRATPDRVQLGSEWRQVLVAAVHEADAVERVTVGPEHILLGLLVVGGQAVEQLVRSGCDPEELRLAVVAVGDGDDAGVETTEGDDHRRVSPPPSEDDADPRQGIGTSGGSVTMAASPPSSAAVEWQESVTLARCPNCRLPLVEQLCHQRVATDAGPAVDVIFCGACGHTLSANPAS